MTTVHHGRPTDVLEEQIEELDELLAIVNVAAIVDPEKVEFIPDPRRVVVLFAFLEERLEEIYSGLKNALSLLAEASQAPQSPSPRSRAKSRASSATVPTLPVPEQTG